MRIVTPGLSSRAVAIASGCVLAAASWLMPPVAQAQERPTLSGSWSASALTEAWSIGEWGEACGPRPAPRGAGGGSVTVSEGGGELAFSGGGYPRTSGCFEMGGGINVSSHSASPRGWRTVCSSPANDPRRATIITTVTATDRVISFDETGQYQFIIKDQNCTASVRRSRSYSLVKRLGEETPPPAETASAAPAASAAPVVSTAAPVPTPAPTPAERPGACATVGEAARIEVRPARKVLRPGESFTPRAVILDASNCRLGTSPAWSMSPPGGKVSVNAAGLVTAAADAPEGEYTVLAGQDGRAARLTVEVVSPERYAQLLASGTSGRDDDGVAVAVLAESSLGSSGAVGQDGSTRRRVIFVGVLGSVVAALAAVGVVMLRRTRPEVEAVEEDVVVEAQPQVVRKARLVARAPSTSAMYCPSCQRGFSTGPTFCPHDGTRLAPNPAWKGPPAAPST